MCDLELTNISAVVIFRIFFMFYAIFQNVWGLEAWWVLFYSLPPACKAHAINKGQWEFYIYH